MGQYAREVCGEDGVEKELVAPHDNSSEGKGKTA